MTTPPPDLGPDAPGPGARRVPERPVLEGLEDRWIERWRTERTYAFVPRVGIERLRDVLLDDADGIAADLDAAMAASVAAYVDPWKERKEPATPGQFRTSLPLTVLA